LLTNGARLTHVISDTWQVGARRSSTRCRHPTPPRSRASRGSDRRASARGTGGSASSSPAPSSRPEAAALLRSSYDLVKAKLSPKLQREIGGPPARRRIPNRLARARPAVKMPGPKKAPKATRRPPSSTSVLTPSRRTSRKKDTPTWPPVAPREPKVPTRKKASGSSSSAKASGKAQGHDEEGVGARGTRRVDAPRPRGAGASLRPT